jgi:hypothetical protein
MGEKRVKMAEKDGKQTNWGKTGRKTAKNW